MSGPPKGLVVTRDESWGAACAALVGDGGATVRMASNGRQAIGQLQQCLFDVIVIDESITSAGVIELVLNVRDLAPNCPAIMLGGTGLTKYANVWRVCSVFFVGPKDSLVTAIGEIMARLSCSHGASNSVPSSRAGVEQSGFVTSLCDRT